MEPSGQAGRRRHVDFDAKQHQPEWPVALARRHLPGEQGCLSLPPQPEATLGAGSAVLSPQPVHTSPAGWCLMRRSEPDPSTSADNSTEGSSPAMPRVRDRAVTFSEAAPFLFRTAASYLGSGQCLVSKILIAR